MTDTSFWETNSRKIKGMISALEREIENEVGEKSDLIARRNTLLNRKAESDIRAIRARRVSEMVQSVELVDATKKYEGPNADLEEFLDKLKSR